MSTGSITELVRVLVAAGATPDIILAAVASAEATKDAAIEASRSKARNRVQRWRDNHAVTSRNVTQRSVADTSRLTRVEDSSSKKDISGKEESKNLSHEFESEIWPSYPLKLGKPNALKAYIAARQRASFETIRAGVVRYAAERAGQDKKYTKQAQGWFSRDGWDDEPIPQGATTRPHSTASPPGQDFNAILDDLQGKTHASHPGPSIDASVNRADSGGASNLVQLNAISARR
jgi:hypothetical protein